MAEASYRHEGVLHGLLTWGVVMLCTFVVAHDGLWKFYEWHTWSAGSDYPHRCTGFLWDSACAPHSFVAILGGAIGTLRNS